MLNREEYGTKKQNEEDNNRNRGEAAKIIIRIRKRCQFPPPEDSLDVASERVSWQKSSDFSPLGSVGSSAGKEAGEAWRARAASMTRQAWGQYRHATYLPPSTPHPPPIHAESDLLLLSNSFFCITRTLNAHAYINTRESTPTTARCV